MKMWAVYHRDYGWLCDACAGGVFTAEQANAVTFRSQREAWRAIDAAELDRAGLEVVRVSVH